MEIRHLALPSLSRRAPWHDVGEIRVGNWIQAWDRQELMDFGLIGVPFSRASIRGSSTDGGPSAIRSAFAYFTTWSVDYEVDISGLTVRDVGDVQTDLLDVPRALQQIEECFTDLLDGQRFFPIALGGDHSITWPIIAAIHNVRPDAKIGIVQFDAHYDLRGPDFGPTHGTPFRRILEGDYGVQGKNLVQLGIHGFGNAARYHQYALEQGVRVISAREIRRRGITDVMDEAITRASDGTDLVYVSLDIDVMAAAYGPGTGVVTAEGLDPYDLLEAMYLLGRAPTVWGLDVVEVDPARDIHEITARTACTAILTFLGGYVHRG